MEPTGTHRPGHIIKGIKYARVKWDQKYRRRKGAENGAPTSSLTPLMPSIAPPDQASGSTNATSASVRFLEEKLGLAQAPFVFDGRNKPRDSNVTPRDMLMWGVSKEFQGRYAYLKERQNLGPHQRYGQAVTESQQIGWNVPRVGPQVARQCGISAAPPRLL